MGFPEPAVPLEFFIFARRSCSETACRSRLVHGEVAITISIAAPTPALTERVELRYKIARRVRSVRANPKSPVVGAGPDPYRVFGEIDGDEVEEQHEIAYTPRPLAIAGSIGAQSIRHQVRQLRKTRTRLRPE